MKKTKFTLIEAMVVVAILFILAGIIIPTVCEIRKPNSPTHRMEIGEDGVKRFVATIDGCEYYIDRYNRNRILCHKGNCKNPIHRGLEKE